VRAANRIKFYKSSTLGPSISVSVSMASGVSTLLSRDAMLDAAGVEVEVNFLAALVAALALFPALGMGESADVAGSGWGMVVLGVSTGTALLRCLPGGVEDEEEEEDEDEEEEEEEEVVVVAAERAAMVFAVAAPGAAPILEGGRKKSSEWVWLELEID